MISLRFHSSADEKENDDDQFHYINSEQVLTVASIKIHAFSTHLEMAVVAHFQCSKWLNLKSFRILYFPTLFNKSICDSCKRNGKADEREREKKIYNTPSEFIIAHIFYIFRENEIFEFLSAFRLHSILQQQKSQMCLCVCVRQKKIEEAS